MWLESPDYELSVLVDEKPKSYTKPDEIPVIQEPKVSDVPKPAIVPKGSPKTFSIKQAIEGKSPTIVTTTTHEDSYTDTDTEIVEDDMEIDLASDEVNPITQIDIVEQWQEFIHSYLGSKPRYAGLLSNYEPSLESDFRISIEFESQLQVDLFNEVKNDLLLYVRKNLDNKNLTFVVSIQAQENGKNKLYTVEDKLKFLNEKNPNIIKLKQQLNLDFD